MAPLFIIFQLPSARAESHGAALGLLGDDPVVGWLIIALLLCFWLLLRVHHSAPPPKRARRAPISHDELARLVFRLVRECDIDGYKELFLAGGEASRVMGPGAEAYLDSRNIKVLEESLVTLAAIIPEGSHFVDSAISRPDKLRMRVRGPDNEIITLDIGTVARIGALWRLKTPAYPAGSRHPYPRSTRQESNHPVRDDENPG